MDIRVEECSFRAYPRIQQSRRFKGRFDAGSLLRSNTIHKVTYQPERRAGTIEARRLVASMRDGRRQMISLPKTFVFGLQLRESVAPVRLLLDKFRL